MMEKLPKMRKMLATDAPIASACSNVSCFSGVTLRPSSSSNPSSAASTASVCFAPSTRPPSLLTYTHRACPSRPSVRCMSLSAKTAESPEPGFAPLSYTPTASTRVGASLKYRSMMLPAPASRSSANSALMYTCPGPSSPTSSAAPSAVTRRSNPSICAASKPNTSTLVLLRPVSAATAATRSRAATITPSTGASASASRTRSPTTASKYAALPDSSRSSAATVSSTRPMRSSACTRMECASVSPVAKDAENSSVASISPSTMRTVCARRRGMFRTAILNITRLRNAKNAVMTAPTRNTTPRVLVRMSVLRPKRVSIRGRARRRGW